MLFFLLDPSLCHHPPCLHPLLSPSLTLMHFNTLKLYIQGHFHSVGSYALPVTPYQLIAKGFFEFVRQGYHWLLKLHITAALNPLKVWKELLIPIRLFVNIRVYVE